MNIRKMHVRNIMFLFGSCFGCTQYDLSQSAPPSQTVARGFVSLDVVSPATCVSQLNKLRNCVIPNTNYTSPPMDTAVPLRTVLSRQLSGNCSTPYPLSVSVDIGDGEQTTYQYLSTEKVVLRREDGGVVQQVTITDNSPWTPIATFDKTCRVSLSVTTNDVDIETRQQAEAVLAVIDQQIAAALVDVQNYKSLLALQSAYAFTRAIANSFHQDLTNETMQSLRLAAIAAAPALEVAALSCGDALSEGQRFTLFDLYVSMVALGEPGAWQNPDGSVKSLNDFYGPGAAEVLAQVESLATNANPSLEATYRQGLESANLLVAQLDQKRTLAVLQLQPWLGE